MAITRTREVCGSGMDGKGQLMSMEGQFYRKIAFHLFTFL